MLHKITDKVVILNYNDLIDFFNIYKLCLQYLGEMIKLFLFLSFNFIILLKNNNLINMDLNCFAGIRINILNNYN